MNPYSSQVQLGAAPPPTSASMAGKGVGGLAPKPPEVSSPGIPLWLIGVGGVVVLGGLVAAVVLTSPSEAPGARDYHRRRRRSYA